jgi:hypothetical protein
MIWINDPEPLNTSTKSARTLAPSMYVNLCLFGFRIY